MGFILSPFMAISEERVERVLSRLKRLNRCVDLENVPEGCQCAIRTIRNDGTSNCKNGVRYCFSLSNGTCRFTCGLVNHKRSGYQDCVDGVVAEVLVCTGRNRFVVSHLEVTRESGMGNPMASLGTPTEQIQYFQETIAHLARERSVADESRELARTERENLYNYMLSQSRIINTTNLRINALNRLKDDLRKHMTFRLPWCDDVEKQDALCAICHVADMSQENSGHLRQCSHQFHHKCIETWFKNRRTCPICREDCNVDNYYV